MSKIWTSRKESSKSLGQLNVEQFMALSSSEEEEHKSKPFSQNKRKRRRRCSPDQEENTVQFSLTGSIDQSEDEDEDGVGVVELRPPGVTNWKDQDIESDSNENCDDDDDDDVRGGPEQGDTVEEMQELPGKKITMVMVQKWVRALEKTHSLHFLRQLCGGLHAAICCTLQHQETQTTLRFHVKDSAVFNVLVVSCFQHVSLSLDHHLGSTSTSHPPSSQEAWPKVRRMVKQYLSDLLTLSQTLQDPAMQCAVLKQIQTMATYFACFPKLVKALNKCLIEKWACGECRVQVLAFLSLRKLVLLQSHPALHALLKKLYLAFVRNCKFTSAASLPGISFTVKSLVELLAMDPPTSYQHGFVYIRQLAIHLRTALTASKKDAQQAVYNWQFVHCLNLWSQVLCHVSHQSLRPLVYPLVQTILGTLQLQPSAKYYPLRIHLLKSLLQLSTTTSTFIPIAPYIVEMIEVNGAQASGKLQTGKPPDLTVLLRATKQLQSTRSFQTVVLNEAFHLLLQYFAGHAHYIGFPELAYPTLTRLQKVSKVTPYSWLRAQLKQLITKVEQVSGEINRDRASVTFSPVQSDLVASWERQRKGQDNAISSLLKTWHACAQQNGEEKTGSSWETCSKSIESDDDDKDSDDVLCDMPELSSGEDDDSVEP